MEKEKLERITFLVPPNKKFQIQAKAFGKRKTVTQVITELLDKWLKEK